MDDVTKLQIANVCYANVAGSFADFMNAKFQGPNFDWNKFPEMMENKAVLWLFMHDIVEGSKKENERTAKKFAREIAETLVKRLEDRRSVKEQIQTAVLQERENCATLCETASLQFDIDVWQKSTKSEISAKTALALADKIRERKDND